MINEYSLSFESSIILHGLQTSCREEIVLVTFTLDANLHLRLNAQRSRMDDATSSGNAGMVATIILHDYARQAYRVYKVNKL